MSGREVGRGRGGGNEAGHTARSRSGGVRLGVDLGGVILGEDLVIVILGEDLVIVVLGEDLVIDQAQI